MKRFIFVTTFGAFLAGVSSTMWLVTLFSGGNVLWAVFFGLLFAASANLLLNLRTALHSLLEDTP